MGKRFAIPVPGTTRLMLTMDMNGLMPLKTVCCVAGIAESFEPDSRRESMRIDSVLRLDGAGGVVEVQCARVLVSSRKLTKRQAGFYSSVFLDANH